MVSGVDYFLECLLSLIRRTHDADNSAGAFDRIALQAYVPGPYFVIQYVKLFFVECKLGNFPSKQTAVVVVVVVVFAVFVVFVVVFVVFVAFDVGINQVTGKFRFEGFEKSLRDTSR
ncbi:hypothetical protein V8E52_004563 [Russula decolorans]